jgi:hypothetical protein
MGCDRLSMKVGSKRAQRGTYYTGETDRHGNKIIRISRDCPCDSDECPFDGRNEFRVEPDMVCDDCGTTLHPNPVQYELGGKTHTAHNLVCPAHAWTVGCLD